MRTQKSALASSASLQRTSISSSSRISTTTTPAACCADHGPTTFGSAFPDARVVVHEDAVRGSPGGRPDAPDNVGHAACSRCSSRSAVSTRSRDGAEVAEESRCRSAPGHRVGHMCRRGRRATIPSCSQPTRSTTSSTSRIRSGTTPRTRRRDRARDAAPRPRRARRLGRPHGDHAHVRPVRVSRCEGGRGAERCPRAAVGASMSNEGCARGSSLVDGSLRSCDDPTGERCT